MNPINDESPRKVPEELERERARLQFIFDSVPVGISLTVARADGGMTNLINDAHLCICGITREQAAEHGIFKKITEPEDYKRQTLLYNKLEAGEIDHFSLEKRYIRPDGTVVWVIFSFQRRRYADSSYEDLSVVVDVTNLKRVEESLLQTQTAAEREKARLQFIFDFVPVGISWTLNQTDGRITHLINDAHLRICGVTREQVDESKWGIFKEISDPEDYKRQLLFTQQLQAGEIDHFSMDKRYNRPDGTVVWALFSYRRLWYPDGSSEDLAVVLDVTERKQMEETLRRSEENLSVTLHSIGDAVLATDAAGRVTQLNPIAEILTGWPQAEAIGRPVAEVFRIINEETGQPAEIPVDKVLVTGEIQGLANHTVVIARDGTERQISDSAAPIRDKDGHILGVVLVFRDITNERDSEKALRESERRLRVLNEALEQRVQERTMDLVNANKKLTEEIARRKHAEELLGKLNAELEQRVQERTRALEEANKELEAFSYSVSHDLRAPLRHIHGYVGLLEADAGKQLPDKSRRYLDIIGDSGKQMGNLIDDLLSFSRMSRSGMHEIPVRLDDLVRESLQKLEMATQGRNIVWKIPPLPIVMGDLAMLRQVFANLLGNAVKYTGPRNPAEIEIGCTGKEDGRIILFVRDNGVGFDMRYAKNLFGVFQRMHRADEFEGTGIGLANVRRIIARHGGRIWAEAELDKGAAFYFTLKSPETAHME